MGHMGVPVTPALVSALVNQDWVDRSVTAVNQDSGISGESSRKTRAAAPVRPFSESCCHGDVYCTYVVFCHESQFQEMSTSISLCKSEGMAFTLLNVPFNS